MHSLLICCLAFTLLNVIHGTIHTLPSDRYVLSESENLKLFHSCGKTSGNSNKKDFKSLYGKLNEPGETPWVVSIIHTDYFYPDMSETIREEKQGAHCSGTLISPRHVLTAAHCFEPRINCKNTSIPSEITMKNLAKFRIYAGGSCAHPKACRDMKRSDKIIGRKISRVYMPSYYGTNYCHRKSAKGGDMAIVELEKDYKLTENIQPACLPKVRLQHPSNVSVEISGYGLDPAQNPKYLNTVGVLKKSVEKLTDCRYNGFPQPKDIVCTFQEFTLVCAGDSGSGNVIDVNGQIQIIASVSFGPSCARVAGVHRRYDNGPISMSTSVYPHLEWICVVSGICSPLIDRERAHYNFGHGLKLSVQGELAREESYAS